MRRKCASFLTACAVVVGLSTVASAQARSGAGGMYDIPFRGGIRAALAAAGDHVSADRSQFLLEQIRRIDRTPTAPHTNQRRSALRALVPGSDAPPSRNGSISPLADPGDTLPLPLSPATWINVVFKGGVTADALAGAIVESANASLLYCALLALDDDTREWLDSRPDLVAFLARHSAAFLVAAPAVRIANGRLQLPGGEPSQAAWESIVGRPTTDPVQFIDELVTRRDGRVAYFLGTIATLTRPQLRTALRLDAPESEVRVDAAKRLYAVFEHVASVWKIDQQPFWRPMLDPALLLTELATDEQGVPRVPMPTRRFWDAVLSDPSGNRTRRREGQNDTAKPDEQIDFVWLAERVFAGPSSTARPRYDTVLFVSRNFGEGSRRDERAVVEAARAVTRYPALTAVLERAGLRDVAAFAAAARRADLLSAIADHHRAMRALAQYQGALALIARAVIRGGLDRGLLPRLVSSLAAVNVSDDGDYQGRLVRWVLASLSAPIDERSDSVRHLIDSAAPGAAEAGLLRLLAGPPPVRSELVEWEGTQYRVDLTSAEAMRLLNVLGGAPRPYVSAARALVAIGDTFHADNALLAADEVMARGLMDLAYAAGFGQPEAASITASEAAGRHDFGVHPWALPEPAYDDARQWHVTGSLLGLDVRLAQLALVRTSLRPPSRRPTLNDGDRRMFTEAVGLINPVSLTDADRDAIVRAVNIGRARVAQVHAASDVTALADEVRLSPTRRTLLAWAVAHEPDRIAQSFSLTELLWLGVGATTRRVNFDTWGAAAEPRLGCLCLRVFDRRPSEIVAGRGQFGILASTFADLNLRLAELLAELQMPAPLLSSVLAAATVDLIENADIRDSDDRRALVDFVQHLRRERVEEYLALFTTDGPLVVVNDRAIPPPSFPRSRR